MGRGTTNWMRRKNKAGVAGLCALLALAAPGCEWLGNKWAATVKSSSNGAGDCGMSMGVGGGGVGGGFGGSSDVGSDSTGSADIGSAGVGGGANATPQDCGDSLTGGGGSGVGGGIDQQALLQQELDDPQGAGGLICSSPPDCVDKCVAEAKYCIAAHAAHPYKAGQVGDLYQCIDAFPSAKNGGSYTCLYRYPNGDACIFAYAAKLGPITIPAPPPLCVYKG
jgi:hypothetical protein